MKYLRISWSCSIEYNEPRFCEDYSTTHPYYTLNKDIMLGLLHNHMRYKPHSCYIVHGKRKINKNYSSNMYTGDNICVADSI